MAEFELFYDLGGEYGDGITLNKHGDRYSLVRAKKSKKAEGTIYLEWCFPQDRDRKPREKAIPLGVQIGNKTEAIAFFKWALSQLQPQPAKGEDDQIPF